MISRINRSKSIFIFMETYNHTSSRSCKLVLLALSNIHTPERHCYIDFTSTLHRAGKRAGTKAVVIVRIHCPLKGATTCSLRLIERLMGKAKAQENL